MDEQSLRVLEYERVRELLLAHASSELGKERVRAMVPLTDLREIEQRQAETAEVCLAIEEQGGIPLGGIRDIRVAVDRAARDGILQPQELLDIADTVYSARRLKFFFARHRSRFPLLNEVATHIYDFSALEHEIRAAISDRAEVQDNASPELAHIRSSIRITHSRVHERIEQILHSPAYEKMIQEPVVVRRSDRLCIPIKAEYRHAFDGLVHDTSASGATVFMEPAAVLALQNDLRELEANEKHEVERILTALSHLVRRRAQELHATLHALGIIDFIHAKAQLSRAQQAVRPRLNSQGRIDLRGARHPLLQGNVVPIDVHLGKEFTTLVITGPNTGGKTVALKTLGLLTLMAQSGLHVPAADGSEMAVFKQVFADIGDEQSIEQSLSTFSAHIRQIVKIVRRIGRNALVLLDEIGAGTDPTEGSALARALLEFLTRQQARTVATTHYSVLKEYAYSHPEIENASVEFDVDTLQPTYRLLIGIPGSSNALTIARRLGLPKAIVDAASSFLGTEHVQVEGLIRRIEEDVRAARNEREAAEAIAADAEKIRRRLQQELDQTRERREKAIAEAAGEASAIVRKAQEEARQILAKLREQSRENRDTNQAMQALKRLSDEVHEAESKAQAQRRPAVQPIEPEPLVRPPRPGDTVTVQPFGGRGVVLEMNEGESEVLVQMGAVKLTVPLSDVQVVGEPKQRPMPSLSSNTMVAKAATFGIELHLRGLMAEEAMLKLDKYLDDAILAGVSSVRVVHGKGTGALRNAVWEFLRKHPHVSAYHLAEQCEGGTGATVVELKTE
ncbi:MAG: endonuclease MutS2 [Armatimonadetes bacterium]|nr:endonuclease MutS2 [Armatimonadota bacterium]